MLSVSIVCSFLLYSMVQVEYILLNCSPIEAHVGCFQFGVIKNKAAVLAGVAQWIECQSENQKVASLIPSQGTFLGCGPGPQLYTLLYRFLYEHSFNFFVINTHKCNFWAV